jgi:TIR domain-containing protein
MPFFNKPELKRAAGRADLLHKSLSDAIRATKSLSLDMQFDIFLSHCYLDKEYVLGLKNLLEKMKYTVYVDWDADFSLSRTNVTRSTADLLKHRMRHCRCLFYAVSGHSSESKWMPWELGFCDGLHGKVAIVPVGDAPSISEEYAGLEYLSLYPYVVKDIHRLTNQEDIWVQREEDEECSHLPNWLNGESI